MNLFEIIKISIISLALIFCCYTDIKERKIKNFITFPLMLIGIIFNIIEMQSIQGMFFSFKGIIFIFLTCILVSIVGGFGFGDTKLLMGLASICGFWCSFDILLFSLLSMILYFVIFKFKYLKDLFINLKLMISNVIYQKTIPKIEKKQSVWPVPYACFISVGTFISLLFYYTKGENFIWTILN